MKKTIFIEILLLIVLVSTILLNVFAWRIVYNFSRFEDATDVVIEYSLCGTFAIISTFCNVAVMIIVAISNLHAFKPLIDKIANDRDDRKAIRKQNRIIKLQTKLDELKKDV